MFDELLGWFAAKESNRRKHFRRSDPFRATVSHDGGSSAKPAIGVDVGAGGLCLFTQEPAGTGEVEIHLTLDARVLKVCARTVWQDAVTHDGKSVWRNGMRFTRISPGDWEAVLAYANDAPALKANEPRQEPIAASMTPDDANRLLPIQLRGKLLAMLVERERLAPLQDGVAPPVRYSYAGVVRRGGELTHRLTIQSQVDAPEGASTYETLFAFDDQGSNIEILN